MSELVQETITNGVAIKQEEVLGFNPDNNIKQEVKNESALEPSSSSLQQTSYAKHLMAVPKKKAKVSVTLKTVKSNSTVQEGAIIPGEAMLRCFQTFNIPVRKKTPHSPKHKNKFIKKSSKRPPPGLIPLQPPKKASLQPLNKASPSSQPPNKASLNDEAWEGQANDCGEVILSALGTPEWSSPASVGSWLADQSTQPSKGIQLTPAMKVLRCDICNYVTNRTNNLNRHYNSMHLTLTQPEECCDVVFCTRADLTKHTRLCHPDSKFPCQYPGCKGYVFDRKALLKRHVLAVHLKDKPFLCPECHYGSSHKSNLDRHMKTIHGMDPSINALAASALNASPAGILEGKNLESVEDFIKLMMEKVAIANIIHNAAFGSVDEMLAGIGPVKMEDVEEMKAMDGGGSEGGGATSQDTSDVKDSKADDDNTGDESASVNTAAKIPNFFTPPSIPDLEEPFEMTSYLEESSAMSAVL